MDNFRKTPKGAGRRSLDGFVTPENTPNRGHKGHDANQVYRPSRLMQPRLDNFKMPDGFTPSQNPSLPNPNQAHKPTEISFHSGNAATFGGMESAAAPAQPLLRKSKRKQARMQRPKKHGKRRWLKYSLRTAGAMAIIVVLIVGFLFGKGYLKARHIFKGGSSAAALNKVVDPYQLKGEGDGRVNILLLGKGGPGHDGPDLTDTILIASIDPIQKEAALLSVPRDLYVKTPDQGSMKINAVYANAKYAILNRNKQTPDIVNQAEKAGISAIENEVSTTMGIPIHYYAMVDFEAFRQAIDAVGGVDVNVPTDLYDPSVAWENGNNPLIARAGTDHMNGKLALLYSRSRHGSARGDFDRTDRQRSVLLSLKAKVLTLGTFTNPIKISQLMDAFGNHVSTDLGLNDVSRIYDIGKDIDSSKVQSIGLADPPNNYVVTGDVNGLSIVRPTAGLNDYSQIQSYVRNTLKDSFLKSENASIIVLNGTSTAGLATKKATELKSYGYNVIKMDTAPTQAYSKTVIVDMTNGTKKYTKHYLEQRFGVSATSQIPDSTIDTTNADFVIILGSDATSTNQ